MSIHINAGARSEEQGFARSAPRFMRGLFSSSERPSHSTLPTLPHPSPYFSMLLSTVVRGVAEGIQRLRGREWVSKNAADTVGVGV